MKKMTVEKVVAVTSEKKEPEKEKPVLPFVTKKSYWAPKSMKDYYVEEVIGGYYAIKYLELLKSGGTDSTVYGLGRIVGDMVKSGKYGSVEIGFISSINEVLRFYGTDDLESYRRWKDSQTISMLKTNLPNKSKLRILDFMALTDLVEKYQKGSG